MTLLEINTGDTAWVLAGAAMVLLMTPGLAMFYGGMVRVRSVLNMMLMSLVSMGIVGVLWVLVGFSMSFGNSWHGLIGNPLQYAGMRGVINAEFGASGHTIPALAFVGFQVAFAMIAVALVSGAVADRMKFSAWCVFAAVWSLLVYFPAAHWVFAFDGYAADRGGWIANTLKVFDFAGGTAIHINAGAAGLALAIVLGRRIGFGDRTFRPHNLTLVMLGAGLLWFGWFGFNAGSALGASQTAGLAWVNTMVATCAAMLAWLATEWIRDGHPTTLGGASGVVAGLVAITPACATVDPLGAIAIGILAGVACSFALELKYRFHFDDALDVVGIHLVGGLVGTLAIGLFGTQELTGGSAGLFYGGGFAQLGRQALGALSVLAYSFVVTSIIALAIKYTMGLRIPVSVETNGIDTAQHAEVGYDLSWIGWSTHRIAHTLVVPRREADEPSSQASPTTSPVITEEVPS